VNADDTLPEGFSFEDFMAALDAVDAPLDEDLPTDGDGCVELVTLVVAQLGSAMLRLRAAGLDPHVELPDDDEANDPGAMASIFVPHARLAEGRRVLGITR
jgi:hypothetical protein